MNEQNKLEMEEKIAEPTANITDVSEASQTTKKEEEEKTKKEKSKPAEKPKKTFVIANGFDIPVSTKHSAAICRFIKGKRIQEAINYLEQVERIRKPIPMKGEIPHRKGRGMMSGRFPEKAAGEFIVLLKSLSANAINHGIENPIVSEAVANIGSRPFGRRGVRRKRTHIKIVAKEALKNQERNKKWKKKIL